jgi:excisionase family DNA binding protein
MVSFLPAAFTVANAVKYSGLSRSRLYELMREGEIASFHVGGRRMILRQAVDAFFNKVAGIQSSDTPNAPAH